MLSFFEEIEEDFYFYYVPTYVLGVKIRNFKVDFKTGGTWRWVGQ